MGFVGLAAGIAAGLVLMVSGFSKLRSGTWPALAAEMGTPRPVIVTLPAFEAMLGLALVLQVQPMVFGGIATALFAAFTAVIAVRYARGDRSPCNCFGGKESPINRWTIARNASLVVIAVLATVTSSA